MRYQDFVIKNGEFVGKFEDMYQNFKDPWLQSQRYQKSTPINHKMILSFCQYSKLFLKRKKIKTLEIGCGFAYLSQSLNELNFDSYGTDISKTAIYKAKKKFPNLKNKLYESSFLNFNLYNKIDPDIFILSEISWYVLPDLKKFLRYLKTKHRNKILIHFLSTYKKKEQKYGKNFFYDLNTIKKFFNLKYIVSNNYKGKGYGNQFSYFLAKL